MAPTWYQNFQVRLIFQTVMEYQYKECHVESLWHKTKRVSILGELGRKEYSPTRENF